MKPSALTVSLGLCISGTAFAGGLLLPGAGAVSSSRAGTGVASTEGGEAIVLNPAGIAKSKGTTITIGAAIINYAMSFQRAGTYDENPEAAEPYEGQAYPVVENDPSPPLGIGSYQPVPLVAITSDLGGRAGGLSIGAGLYAPSAYPFRNMNTVNGQPYFVPNDTGGYDFPTTFDSPPPPNRYDIIEQEAAIILPSVVAAYRVTEDLDVGGRFSAGFAEVKSSIAVWGGVANYDDWVQRDSLFTVDAKDSLITTWGLGATYRPAPAIEVAANYTAPIAIVARGDARTSFGPETDVGGQPVTLFPTDPAVKCAAGGTSTVLKGCVELEIPMTATVGGRYKFLDDAGTMLGDLELNVGWQNWSAERASSYRVVVDAKASMTGDPENAIDLKQSFVAHGLRDTFSVLLGGSWNFPLNHHVIVARGGLGYETAAAKKGWERADFDGAARMLATAGGSYRMERVQIDLGVGYIHQGTRTEDRGCNPTLQAPAQGCGPGGAVQPVEDRQGPDPINPLVVPASQAESPVNQGTFKSHYLMFMLGMSTWF